MAKFCALHVVGHLDKHAVKLGSVKVLFPIFGVVEERIHQSFVHIVPLRKRRPLVFCTSAHLFRTQAVVRLVHIIHVVHAGIVLNNKLWVEQQKLLQGVFHG